MFYERYCELCTLRGESPTGVAVKLGFSKGTVSSWKDGKGINSKSLELIADYFGVSTDYLLGREELMTDPNFLGGLPYTEYANLSKADRDFIDDLIRRMNGVRGD